MAPTPTQKQEVPEWRPKRRGTQNINKLHFQVEHFVRIKNSEATRTNFRRPFLYSTLETLSLFGVQTDMRPRSLRISFIVHVADVDAVLRLAVQQPRDSTTETRAVGPAACHETLISSTLVWAWQDVTSVCWQAQWLPPEVDTKLSDRCRSSLQLVGCTHRQLVGCTHRQLVGCTQTAGGVYSQTAGGVHSDSWWGVLTDSWWGALRQLVGCTQTAGGVYSQTARGVHSQTAGRVYSQTAGGVHSDSWWGVLTDRSRSSHWGWRRCPRPPRPARCSRTD